MLKEGERKSENPLSEKEIELCQTFLQRKCFDDMLRQWIYEKDNINTGEEIIIT